MSGDCVSGDCVSGDCVSGEGVCCGGIYSISHKKVKVPYALVRLRYA